MKNVFPRTKALAVAQIPNARTTARWLVWTMTRTTNGRWLCLGRECHSVYDAAEVIHPDNEDYGLWVGR